MEHHFPGNVIAFHQKAAPYSPMSRFRESVGMPDAKFKAHVMALITEEYTELTTAMIVDENLPDTADALLDIIYVCLQGLFSLGLSEEQVTELWAEVQRANMSKVDPAYGLLDGNGGKPYHDTNGKITKPPGFTPPDIEGKILEFRRRE